MRHIRIFGFAVSAFEVIVAIGLMPGSASTASGADGPLRFYKSDFVTGDYRAGGVGLRGQGVFNSAYNGYYATGVISMAGVPDKADIVAAYLYWSSMESSSQPSAAVGYFRNIKITGKKIGPDGISSCWSSGGGSGTGNGAQALRVYRADVLRFLPVAPPSAKVNPGRFLVNATDLAADGFGPLTVSVADSGGGGTTSSGTGNQATYTEGASLVVVYRIPSEPLRAVVIYDGAY